MIGVAYKNNQILLICFKDKNISDKVDDMDMDGMGNFSRFPNDKKKVKYTKK